MKIPCQRSIFGFFLVWLASLSFASAYNARPKLIVIIVIDQFRGDYLERYRDLFGEGGFRLFLDHGANFTDCDYNYANTRTAPGHATLLTGAYSDGHGIIANEWWDSQKKRMVNSVEDESTQIVGVAASASGSSPHNLLADTLGDELKLATQGKSRVFAIALKDRAAVLSAGMSGDGAYWLDRRTGMWITSTYYRSELPKWVQDFNDSKRREKYNLQPKDPHDNIARATTPAPRPQADFEELAGSTAFANDYTFEFARELMTNEKLGGGQATDLLVIGLSANDILGHRAGPDSPQVESMSVATDRQLAAFFDFLKHQVGLANVWLALSADHGIAPLPEVAAKFRIPAANLSPAQIRSQLNELLSEKLSPGKSTEYAKALDYPIAWLDSQAFAALKISEEDAERDVGEAMLHTGLRAYYTRAQLARGDIPNNETGLKYLHSYSPRSGWYVMGVPPPF